MPGKIAILHYSGSPVVGGVESVIDAHTRLLGKAGYPVTLIAGAGDPHALAGGADFQLIPEMDSQDPGVLKVSQALEQGQVPAAFEALTNRLVKVLKPILRPFKHVIIHNLFTKHFNLPLTVALGRLLDSGSLHGGIAWCHDFSWTSPHSRSKVFPGYPWDSLRTYRPDLTYVTISKARRSELAGLLNIPEEKIQVIYNGVDADNLLDLSPEGQALIQRLGVMESDLVLLMPVRITQAKNIEFALQVTARLKALDMHPTLVITGPPDPHDPVNMDYYRTLLHMRLQLKVEKEARFVFDSGPQTGQPYTIDTQTVAELYRASDILFSPSLREGFGMPVLEAGLVGLPVFCANFPAAREIGAKDVVTFSPDATPTDVAGMIADWADSSPVHRLRRRVRQGFTWQAIFDKDILPLLEKTG